ncbi:hypothetical protein EVAR_59670_1 [Eumeta japonica]|uniref:Uncharacterized protein n=1 Tax=Eumeta variegata TaxID=151549 RepID=A0A4C1YZ35_EUMVA|nr:hypothetical protein EVAR_59670_1 [Eumeta japonica]
MRFRVALHSHWSKKIPTTRAERNLVVGRALHAAATPQKQVKILYKLFERGRINLTDDLREGRPSTATTEDISAVRLMIETEGKMTYQMIRTSLGIGAS